LAERTPEWSPPEQAPGDFARFARLHVSPADDGPPIVWPEWPAPPESLAYLGQAGETSAGRKGQSWRESRQFLASADPNWDRMRINKGLSSGEG
jgi:hypothetical protein